MTRSRPAAPMRRRSLGVVEGTADARGERLAVAGDGMKQVSPSVPATSGIAPPVVATSGHPVLIASMAGSENPSYSDGTTAQADSL